MKNLFGIVALVAAVSAPVMADEFYIGADVGQSKLSGNVDGFNVSKTDTASSFFGGYQFNKNVAAELAYRDYGNISNGNGTVKAHSYQASVLGSLPLSNDFALTGRLGLADIKATGSDNFGDSASETKTRAVYGIGARYSVSKEIGLRAEYTRAADIDNLTLSTLTVGADYRF